jgi:hypothetical protein
VPWEDLYITEKRLARERACFGPLPGELVTWTARAGEADSAVASSLLNVGGQVGGSIGLAVLGTLAWTWSPATCAALT